MYQFADAVARQTGLSEDKAREVLRVAVDELMDTLVRDGRVQLGHFGIFEVKVRKGRRGRNPRTGERIEIPSKVVASFTFSAR